jgi:hypothetical protein
MTWKLPRLTSALRGFRTLSLVASLSACSVLAGCGGGAHATVPRADADSLAALARQIADEGSCDQRRDIPRLQQSAFGLVAARRVSPALGRQLLAGVNALAAEAPPCVPSVPTTTVTAPPRPAPKKPKQPKKHADHHHGKRG